MKMNKEQFENATSVKVSEEDYKAIEAIMRDVDDAAVPGWYERNREGVIAACKAMTAERESTDAYRRLYYDALQEATVAKNAVQDLRTTVKVLVVEFLSREDAK